MHTGILSDKERQMLRQYLETGAKDKHFRILKMRIKNSYPVISIDYQLINQVMSKMNSSKST